MIIERTSVGLDVHARSVVGCAIDNDTGESPSYQVSRSFLFLRRDRDLHDLSQAQQLRKVQGIVGVRLDPISSGSLQLRGCRDQARR